MLIRDCTCTHSRCTLRHSRKNILSGLNCFQRISDDTCTVIVNIYSALKKKKIIISSLSSQVKKAHDNTHCYTITKKKQKKTAQDYTDLGVKM